MNKIYRIIWSKVKHGWIVVSEIAKRCGKAGSQAVRAAVGGSKGATGNGGLMGTGNRLTGRVASSLLLAAVLAVGYSQPAAWAESYYVYGTNVHNNKETYSSAWGINTVTGKMIWTDSNDNKQTLAKIVFDNTERKYKIVDATLGSTTQLSNVTYSDYESAFDALKANSDANDGYDRVYYATAFGVRTTAGGSGSTAFGLETTASNVYSTAFGVETTASGVGSTAFGLETTASGQDSTAFGYGTTASSIYSTAFGVETTASGDLSTAFGYKSTASGVTATAWGGYMDFNGGDPIEKAGGSAFGAGATAFGLETTASGDFSTAFGSASKAGVTLYGDVEAMIDAYSAGEGITRYKIVRVGNGSVLDDNSGSGYDSIVSAREKLTIYGQASTAFGIESKAYADNSLAALGGYTEIDATNSAAIGNGAKASLADTVALGSGAVANRAAGAQGYSPDGKTYSGNAWVSTHNAIAVGASENNSDAATVTRQITGVAAGTFDTDAVNVAQLKAVEQGMTDIARDAVTVKGANGIEVTQSADKSTYTVNAKLSDNLTVRGDGNIDLADVVKVGNGADTISLDGNAGSVKVGGTTLDDSGLTIADGPSVTKDGIDAGNKKITNVAAGTNDTDAVNVAQLKAVEQGMTDIARDAVTVKGANGIEVTQSADKSTYTVNAKLSDNLTVRGDGNIDLADVVKVGNGADAKTVTIDGTVGEVTGLTNTTWSKDGVYNAGRAATEEQLMDLYEAAAEAAKAGVEVKGGTNIVSVEKNTGDEGQIVFTVNADGASVSEGSDAVKVTKGSKGKNVTDYAIDLSDTTKATLEKVENEGLAFAGDTGTSDKIKLGDTLNLKGGATGALSDGNIGVEAEGTALNIKLAKDIRDVDSIQVNKALQVGDTISLDGNAGSVKVGGTTLDDSGLTIADGPSVTKDGIDAGNKKITNVAAGTNDTDAVNVAQLKAVEQQATGNDIILNNRINNMDNKINKVGAGAAALAALHPIDTDDKFSMGLGYGHYHSANAGAIGLFYRPTDKVMLSVGGTMGNGENMINAGITFALDKGKGFGTSKAAMARKINQQENQIQALQIENAKLAERLAAIEAKLAK